MQDAREMLVSKSEKVPACLSTNQPTHPTNQPIVTVMVRMKEIVAMIETNIGD